MEAIVDDDNLAAALKRVQQNRGSPGVDRRQLPVPLGDNYLCRFPGQGMAAATTTPGSGSDRSFSGCSYELPPHY